MNIYRLDIPVCSYEDETKVAFDSYYFECEFSPTRHQVIKYFEKQIQDEIEFSIELEGANECIKNYQNCINSVMHCYSWPVLTPSMHSRNTFVDHPSLGKVSVTLIRIKPTTLE